MSNCRSEIIKKWHDAILPLHYTFIQCHNFWRSCAFAWVRTAFYWCTATNNIIFFKTVMKTWPLLEKPNFWFSTSAYTAGYRAHSKDVPFLTLRAFLGCLHKRLLQRTVRTDLLYESQKVVWKRHGAIWRWRWEQILVCGLHLRFSSYVFVTKMIGDHVTSTGVNLVHTEDINRALNSALSNIMSFSKIQKLLLKKSKKNIFFFRLRWHWKN